MVKIGIEAIAVIISGLLMTAGAGYIYFSETEDERKLSDTYVPADGKASYLTLNPDGTFFVSQEDRNGGSFVGEWKIENNNTLLLIKKNGYVIKCSVLHGKNDSMAFIDPDGDIWVKK